MNDAYDDDAVGWDSLVGYPDPNVTIPVSYEAFVEEWNSAAGPPFLKAAPLPCQ